MRCSLFLQSLLVASLSVKILCISQWTSMGPIDGRPFDGSFHQQAPLFFNLKMADDTATGLSAVEKQRGRP
jgi:hypothetical protein